MRSLLVAALVAAAPLSVSAEVPFIRGDVKAALARAKAENKPLMVDVFATWCGPCKELDARVFSTKEAEAALAGVVALKVDGEAGEGPAFVERYHVVGYPTVLFLDAGGREIDRVFGSMPLTEFLQTARDYLAGKGTLEEQERRFRTERPADLELASELLFRHAVKGHEDEVGEYQALLDGARAALRAGKPEPKSLLGGTRARLDTLCADGLYVTGRYLWLRGKKDYARARDTLLALRKQFPDSESAKSAGYDLALAYHGLKDEKRTRETLDQYLADHQRSAGAANTYAWFCFKQRFELDRGIEIAEAALKQNPKEDGLWDTLAELHAAKGDKLRALEAIGHAIAAKPDDAYYREQRAKFEALRAK